MNGAPQSVRKFAVPSRPASPRKQAQRPTVAVDPKRAQLDAVADDPLAAGMVLSVETHIADPEVGFVKLEDTVIVTDDGPEAVGDHERGWNVIPT